MNWNKNRTIDSGPGAFLYLLGGLRYLGLIAAAVCLLAACGSDQEKQGESESPKSAAVQPAAPAHPPERDVLRIMRRTLTENGFDSVAEKMEAYVRPTVLATTARAREKDFRLGQSKIGGLAHVPPDFVWPTFKGAPLYFVAQINLSELPPGPVASDLPARGLMSFFYADGMTAWGFGLEDKGAAVVHLYQGDFSQLKPTEKPAGKNDIKRGRSGEVYRYKPSSLTFREAYELPTSLELFDLDELLAEVEPAQRERVEEIMAEAIYGLDEDGEELPADRETRPEPAGPSPELQQRMSDRAAQLINEAGLNNSKELSPEESMEASMRITELINSDPEMQQMLAEAASQAGLKASVQPKADGPRDDARYSGRHKILGWPNLVQGSVFFEAQQATTGLDLGDYEQPNLANLKAVEAGAKDWRLLLQVDSDGNSEIMWGDLGTLYFLIKKDDLAAGRFDDIWFSWQCH